MKKLLWTIAILASAFAIYTGYQNHQLKIEKESLSKEIPKKVNTTKSDSIINAPHPGSYGISRDFKTYEGKVIVTIPIKWVQENPNLIFDLCNKIITKEIKDDETWKSKDTHPWSNILGIMCMGEEDGNYAYYIYTSQVPHNEVERSK